MPVFNDRPITVPPDQTTRQTNVIKTEQPSRPNENNGVDLYSNIRKQDFINSGIEVGLGTGKELEEAPEYLLVDKNNLSQLFEKLECPNCNLLCLKLVITKKCGFNSQLSVECDNCKNSLASVSSSAKIPDNSGYDVNMRVAKAFTSLSEGHAALEKFSMFMNMDCMSKDLYSKCSQQVYKLGKTSGIQSLVKARARVRQFLLSENLELTNDSIIDLSVSLMGLGTRGALLPTTESAQSFISTRDLS